MADIFLLSDVAVRKGAHVLLYVVLGGLAAWLLAGHRLTGWRRAAGSVLFCALYATTDELHQLFIPGRSGELRDVLIDTIGGVVGVVAVMWRYKSKIPATGAVRQ